MHCDLNNSTISFVIHKNNPKFTILNDTLLSLGFRVTETINSSYAFDLRINDLRLYDFLIRQIDILEDSNVKNKEFYDILKSILHNTKAQHIVKINNTIHSLEVTLEGHNLKLKGNGLTFLNDVFIKICMLMSKYGAVFKCDEFSIREFNIMLNSEKEKVKKILEKDEVKSEIKRMLTETKLQNDETAEIFVCKLLQPFSTL